MVPMIQVKGDIETQPSPTINIFSIHLKNFRTKIQKDFKSEIGCVWRSALTSNFNFWMNKNIFEFNIFQRPYTFINKLTRQHDFLVSFIRLKLKKVLEFWLRWFENSVIEITRSFPLISYHLKWNSSQHFLGIWPLHFYQK